MRSIEKRPSARRDLVNIFHYYLSQDTLTTARRFLIQAEATFQVLAINPGIGTRYEPYEPLYAELRFFPVNRFRLYLVFYRPTQPGIEIFRVLHGARDIESVLGDEFGTGGDTEAED